MNTEIKKPVQLKGKAAHYMSVPIELITEFNNGKWLTAMYLYTQVRTGLDGLAYVARNDAVDWLGKKKNNNDTGVNTNLSKAMFTLVDWDYVQETDKKNWYRVNPDQRTGREGFNRYTILYLDEIEKIINYCKENNEPHVEKVLLLFAYYRINIFRKKLGGIANYAEIYADYFTNIAKNTFMTIDTVRWATNILSKLNLIKHYTPEASRSGEEWITGKSIFVNYERRSGSQLLDGGDKYYKEELNKAQLQISEGNAHEKYEDGV